MKKLDDKIFIEHNNYFTIIHLQIKVKKFKQNLNKKYIKYGI